MEKSEKTALQAILITLFIFGIKVIAAIITGSIALKAEAYEIAMEAIGATQMDLKNFGLGIIEKRFFWKRSCICFFRR